MRAKHLHVWVLIFVLRSDLLACIARAQKKREGTQLSISRLAKGEPRTMAEFLPAPALLPSPLASMAFAEQRAERIARERARKAQADKEFLERQSERLDAERARKVWDKQARQLISLRREMKERQEPGYGPKRWCWPGAVHTHRAARQFFSRHVDRTCTCTYMFPSET